MTTDADTEQLLTHGRIGLGTGYYKVACECFEQVLELGVANQEALDGLVRIEEILLREEPVGDPTWLEARHHLLFEITKILLGLMWVGNHWCDCGRRFTRTLWNWQVWRMTGRCT